MSDHSHLSQADLIALLDAEKAAHQTEKAAHEFTRAQAHATIERLEAEKLDLRASSSQLVPVNPASSSQLVPINNASQRTAALLAENAALKAHNQKLVSAKRSKAPIPRPTPTHITNIYNTNIAPVVNVYHAPGSTPTYVVQSDTPATTIARSAQMLSAIAQHLQRSDADTAQTPEMLDVIVQQFGVGGDEDQGRITEVVEDEDADMVGSAVVQDDGIGMPRYKGYCHKELFEDCKVKDCPYLHEAQAKKFDPEVIEALPQSREAVWQANKASRRAFRKA
jgi:hypothetical protein